MVSQHRNTMSSLHCVTGRVQLPGVSLRLESAVGQPQHGVHDIAHCLRARGVVAEPSHERHGAAVSRVLKHNLIGHELIVEARCREGVRQAHVEVEHVAQREDGARRDLGAAGGADDKVRLAVGPLNDDGRDGREGPLAGADEIGRARNVTEAIGLVVNGEVVPGSLVSFMKMEARTSRYLG
jgi:hypothetical protein